MNDEDEPIFNFEAVKNTKKHNEVRNEVDELLNKKVKVEDRVRLAHEIKKKPPKPGFMKVDVKPAIYSIDLNTDAHWWFNHVCTVFPLLIDQGIRTHVDLRDSYKAEKRLPDFNYMFLFIVIIGAVAMVMITKLFGWW